MSTLDNGVFCFACENAALKECNRLVAENAKLRGDLEDQEGYDQMLRDRLRQQTELCVKAEAENAKLHNKNAKLLELCKQMYPRAKAFLQMGVQLGCNDTLSYDWELQMQELLMEVPE